MWCWMVQLACRYHCSGGAGAPGPVGRKDEGSPPGTRPFVASADEDDFPLDSWTVIQEQGRRDFCRCRRGPIVSYATEATAEGAPKI